jgi:hypothetical protein
MAITQSATMRASRTQLTTSCTTALGLEKCNGVINMSIELLDNSHSPAATDFITADVELIFGDVSTSPPVIGITNITQTINLSSVNFTYNPTTSRYESVFDLFNHYAVCGTTTMNSALLACLSNHVQVGASLLSITGSTNAGWCWDDPTCSQTGASVAGVVANPAIAPPNTPIGQGLLILGLTVTPGAVCSPSFYTGFINFASLTTNPSDFYHFDVVILEQQGANQVQIGSQRIAMAAAPIAALGGSIAVPFAVSLPQTVNTNCFIAIRNIEVRTGSLATDPLVT